MAKVQTQNNAVKSTDNFNSNVNEYHGFRNNINIDNDHNSNSNSNNNNGDTDGNNTNNNFENKNKFGKSKKSQLNMQLALKKQNGNKYDKNAIKRGNYKYPPFIHENAVDWLMQDNMHLYSNNPKMESNPLL